MSLEQGTLVEGELVNVQNSGEREKVVPTAGDGKDLLVLSRVWHREDIGVIRGAAENAYFAPSIQAIVYLHATAADTHAFSIVPESAEQKRNMPTKYHDASRPHVLDYDPTFSQWPSWSDYLGRLSARCPYAEYVHAPAGSVIVFVSLRVPLETYLRLPCRPCCFSLLLGTLADTYLLTSVLTDVLQNNASIHAATVRRTSQIRRTLHIRFRTLEPTDSSHGLSGHATIAEFHSALPRRLWGSEGVARRVASL
jgi:hypothetical protein